MCGPRGATNCSQDTAQGVPPKLIIFNGILGSAQGHNIVRCRYVSAIGLQQQ